VTVPVYEKHLQVLICSKLFNGKRLYFEAQTFIDYFALCREKSSSKTK